MLQARQQPWPLNLNVLYHKGWVVYCKQPLGSPVQLIDYLGRYTHRIAIGNERIIRLEDDQVTFSYRDRADNN